MITTVSLHGLIFGFSKDEDLPKLPRGFAFVKSTKDWLMAEDENGGRWFVGQNQLVRCGYATECDVRESKGKLELGQRFLDSRQAINLNREAGEVIS